MTKKVTLNDISKQLGLSTAAVSKALRGLEGISPETRKAVLETAKKMRYKDFAEPSSDSAVPGGRVLFVVDPRFMSEAHTMASYFFADKTLKDNGFQCSLQSLSVSGEIEDETVFRDKNVVALFLFGRITAKSAERLNALNKPILLLDHEFPYADIDSVMVDHYEGAFLAVRHFVQNGHIHIGFIGDNKLSPGFLARYRGYCDALEFWGLERRQEYVYDFHFADAFGDIHFDAIPDKLDYANLPTAFFCANDPIAFVVNQALMAQGIRTPDDVSIIGFDNLEACQWQSPPITSLDYQREQIAVQAVNLMRWRMDNPDAPRNKIMVKPELAVRKSVALPPRK